MEQQAEYLRRLAELDQVVARARPAPDVLVERAAGLIAGRVGCRFSEAHAYLLQVASQRSREPADVAAEMISALEASFAAPSGGRLRAVVDRALPGRRAERTARRVTDDAVPATQWPVLMQQILDVMPGQHSAVLPVRDGAGAVVDFQFAAMSPAVLDISGRTGTEIPGRTVRDTYPSLVDGPVWRAWCDTIGDGQPRVVGPVPYLGNIDRAPAQMSITVRIWRVGPGLLSTWVRHDEQGRLAERIAQTERLGALGWGETDLVTGEVVWSEELYRIYERDPALGPMSLAEQSALIVPEDRPILSEAAESYGRGETVDVTYRIRLDGGVRYVRGVADAIRDAQGRPVRLYGIVQDVTARETSRTRLRDVERQLREHQRSLAEEHRLAAQLQQIVLPIPAEPIDLAGLRVGVRYLPAEQVSRVGGDWYHAATADDGSVLLAVGDVAGHGIGAAAVMAQLRHALAALIITTTTDPATLLAHLNRLLYAAGPTATTATAVVGRYDPATRALVWAQAGHPAPLFARGGHTRQLRRPPGPLLGAVPGAVYATATLTLDPGDLLVLYTDGLIEHRGHTLDEGLAPTIATLDRISASRSEQPLADLLGQLRRANPDDDTCILAVRVHLEVGARPESTATATPDPDRTGVDGPVMVRDFDRRTLLALRRDVERYAADRGLRDLALHRFVVGVNEVAVNAVQHGGGAGRLELWRGDGELHCRVSDRGPGMVDADRFVPTRPPPDAIHGRGLWMARMGCARISMASGEGGLTVVLTRPLADA